MVLHTSADIEGQLSSFPYGIAQYGSILDQETFDEQSVSTYDTASSLLSNGRGEDHFCWPRRVFDFIRETASKERSWIFHSRPGASLDYEVDHHAPKKLQSLKYRACCIFPSKALTIWVCVPFLAFLIALMAYVVDISDLFLFDHKYGYCRGSLQDPQIANPFEAYLVQEVRRGTKPAVVLVVCESHFPAKFTSVVALGY